jgi:membrane fusion protein (multidrug efflux system)
MDKLKFKILIIILLCCSYSCKQGKNEGKGSGNQTKAVTFLEGYIAKPSLLEQTITISGTLKPFEETTLMTDVTGRIVAIHLVEGQFVKQGTLLVKLFDDDLQAQLHKAKAQLEIANQTYKRQSELVKVEGISQSDVDQVSLQINSIKGDIEVIQAQIRKTEVLAPFDGVIGLKNVSMGAVVNSGTSLAIIRAVHKLKLDFSVPEKYSNDIHKGTKIRFTVQGDEKVYLAEVIATEQGIDVNTRNLKARAVVNNNSTLVPGAFANVEVKLAENHQAFLVPTQAIIPRERNKQIIVTKNGKAAFITVKTGIRQDSIIEVTDGIKAGDTIVTTGILFIKPKMDLKFSKVK